MSTLWDILIIGAGPAGSVSAKRLASKGLKVLLVDKSAFPREKVCGGCLSERALSLLKQAGLEDFVNRLPGTPLTQFCVGQKGRIVNLPLPPGRSVSRRFFDFGLIQEAQKAGAEFFPETKAQMGEVKNKSREVILQNQAKCDRALAKIVLICDGLAGTSLTSEAGAYQTLPNSRWGVGASFLNEDPFYAPGTIYMTVSKQGYAGAVRLENGELNIAAALDSGETDFKFTLTKAFESAGFPVPENLGSVDWKGTPALTRSRLQLAGERFFVLGDAASYSEPFTGEGMAWAIESALGVSSLLKQEDDPWKPVQMSLWEKWHQKHIKSHQQLSRLLTRGLRSPWLVRVGLLLASCQPWFARPLTRTVWGAAPDILP